MTCLRILTIFCSSALITHLYSADPQKKLSFVKEIEPRSFGQRSHSFGLGYLYQSYAIDAQLERIGSYPDTQLHIRPIEMNVKTEHVFLQFAVLGPASYHNFWLGFKTVLGYAYTANASSAQAAYPIIIQSTYLSHQQMLGYFIRGMRFYTMLGLTSDFLMDAKMKSGDEKLNKIGPDGIFAHSGLGVFVRFGPIILNAEMRIPVWQVNYNRHTGLHALFTLCYEIFG